MENTSANIQQNCGLGRETTQIGIQNNYTGLSAMDATKIAFELFHQHYPQLQQEALSEVRRIIDEEMKKIPAEDIMPPRPKTIIPVLHNASITEEEELRQMYTKLLVGDMNAKIRHEVHPSFCEILNQLSASDANLFRTIQDIENSIPVARIRFCFDSKYLLNVFPHYFSPYFESLDPWSVSLGIENLDRLNLISLFVGTVNNYNYENIKEHPFVQKQYLYAQEHNPTRKLKIELSTYVIQPNDFGRALAKICL